MRLPFKITLFSRIHLGRVVRKNYNVKMKVAYQFGKICNSGCPGLFQHRLGYPLLQFGPNWYNATFSLRRTYYFFFWPKYHFFKRRSLLIISFWTLWVPSNAFYTLTFIILNFILKVFLCFTQKKSEQSNLRLRVGVELKMIAWSQQNASFYHFKKEVFFQLFFSAKAEG